MEVRFGSDTLERLETDPSFSGGFPQSIVKAFRKRMQQIRAAVDERDLYAIKSLHFEKLSGARQHQHSMRLNDQFRLVLELETSSAGKVLVVIKIEDYH